MSDFGEPLRTRLVGEVLRYISRQNREGRGCRVLNLYVHLVKYCQVEGLIENLNWYDVVPQNSGGSILHYSADITPEGEKELALIALERT
jgi:hypothetical protein